MVSSCAAVYPTAYRPPTTLPMLVPVITSTGTPASSSTFNTPMWASPRAAPPDRATPTFWARAPHHGSTHATSTRANRFTVCPIGGFEGLRTVALPRQSGGGARGNGRKHAICSEGGRFTFSLEGIPRHDPPAKLRPTAELGSPHGARPPAGAGSAGGRATQRQGAPLRRRPGLP